MDDWIKTPSAVEFPHRLGLAYIGWHMVCQVCPTMQTETDSLTRQLENVLDLADVLPFADRQLKAAITPLLSKSNGDSQPRSRPLLDFAQSIEDETLRIQVENLAGILGFLRTGNEEAMGNRHGSQQEIVAKARVVLGRITTWNAHRRLGTSEFSEELVRKVLRTKYDDVADWTLIRVSYEPSTNQYAVLATSPRFNPVEAGAVPNHIKTKKQGHVE